MLSKENGKWYLDSIYLNYLQSIGHIYPNKQIVYFEDGKTISWVVC